MRVFSSARGLQQRRSTRKAITSGDSPCRGSFRCSRRRSWRAGNAVVLLDHSRPAVCYLPLLCSGDRAAKRRSPAGEYLDQLRHGWRPGKPGGRAVKPARQADVSARLREGVVPIDQDRGRAVEAPRLRVFLRGDQDALDFDPAPKFFESLLQSVVSHVPVGAPIEVEKLELHASILLPPLRPEVLPDGTHAHAADALLRWRSMVKWLG